MHDYFFEDFALTSNNRQQLQLPSHVDKKSKEILSVKYPNYGQFSFQ